MKYLRIIYNRIFRRKEIDIQLQRLQITSRDIEMEFDKGFFSNLISSLIPWFENGGGINWVSMKAFDYETMQPWELVFRKAWRPTPVDIANTYFEIVSDIANGNTENIIERAQRALVKTGQNKLLEKDA